MNPAILTRTPWPAHDPAKPSIPRGMADPLANLHDTRAGYPPEWVDVAPKLNRAQRRAAGQYLRLRAMSRQTGAPVAECERWLTEAGGDSVRALEMMRRGAR